jgi:HPt (histidine-containing phosphotransfer) domain-containing protein
LTAEDGAVDTGALDELRASVGNDPEFFAEIVGDFLTEAPDQLDALRAALASGDAPRAARAAHTLKGTSRTFGAGGLAALCQEVEAAAGSGDLETGSARIDRIDGEWARVQSELAALRDGPA